MDNRNDTNSMDGFERKLNFVCGASLIMNGALSGTFMSYPYVFYHTGGIYTMAIIHTLSTIMILGTYIMLGNCLKIYPHKMKSFDQLVETICGEYFKIFNQIVVVCYFFVLSIVFVIYISDQLIELFLLIPCDVNKKCLYHNIYIIVPLVCGVLFLPNVFPHDLTIYSYIYLLSTASMIAIPIMLFIKFGKLSHSRELEPIKFWALNPKNILESVAAIALGMQNHLAIVPISCQLKHNSIRYYILCVSLAIAGLWFIYGSTGLIGMALFGKNTKEDLLLNFLPNDYIGIASRIAIVFVTITNYITLMFFSHLNLFRVTITELMLKIFNFISLKIESSDFMSFSTEFNTSDDDVFMRANSCSIELNEINTSDSSQSVHQSETQNTSYNDELTINNTSTEFTKKATKYTTGILWIACTIGLALYRNHIGKLLNCLGSICSYIVFICPGIITLKLITSKSTPNTTTHTLLLCLAIFYVSIGVLISIYTIVLAVIK